jgi:hypothetical protein
MIKPGNTGQCPHCRTGVRFEPFTVVYSNNRSIPLAGIFAQVPSQAGLDLHVAGCPVCGRPSVSISRIYDIGGSSNGGPGVVYPGGATRLIPPEVGANDSTVATDFSEAVAVLPYSNKASAALSRRCLQRILSTVGNAKKRDLADQIDEVLPALPPQIAENVDAIRQVGNFAAHALKSTNTGEIIDVEEGEAEWLLDVLEELFVFYYVAPAQATARRKALNKKLADLGKPPLKKLQSNSDGT